MRSVLVSLALLVAAPAIASDPPAPGAHGTPAPAATRPKPRMQPRPAPPPARMTDEECRVWARELSFARSVADHDAQAFAEHLHPQAAFGTGQPQPTRGREAIAREWAGLIRGDQVTVHWYPTRTTIPAAGGPADVAWSSGPSLFEHLDPAAPQRYSIGAFHSVWHRGDDGVWRVLFDDGVPGRPAGEAEVAAFHAGRVATCPQG